MNIDSHQHFWIFNPVRDAWITEQMGVIRTDCMPEDLFRELLDNGMDGSVAVQADQSEEETSFLLDIAEKYDFVKGVVGWVDLKSRSLDNRLAFYHTNPWLKGFRHIVQGEPDDLFLLGDDFCRGISLLKDYSYTYDILVYPKQLPAVMRFVERFPEQKFVIDHLAKPAIKNHLLEPWASQMREIARHPNVYCKVSGMATEADWEYWKPEDMQPYLDVVFGAFGPARLMFGSDWPVCLVAGGYARVKHVVTDYLQQFSEAESRAVMGENAVSFYNL
jgi:L-fuconolactonase